MKLKDFLKKNRWTQRKLAQELGVSEAYITYILNGKNNPSPILAKRIEELTDGAVTVYDLIDVKAPSRYKVKRNDEEISVMGG